MGRGPVRDAAHPRDVAVRVITRVLSDSQPLDEALANVFDAHPVAARAWLTEVCSGSLRWKGRIDHIIDSVALKKKPSGWLRKVLMIGVYQLIAQERTSPSRVVSETVEEIKRKEGEAPAKFANALLRKVADSALMWREWRYPNGANAEDAARWASMPAWMWKRIAVDHGMDWAKAYAVSSLERPTLWIRARRGDWDAAGAERGPVESSWKSLGGGSSGPSEGGDGAVPLREGFKEGEFIVQDISSQQLISEVASIIRDQGGPADVKKTALDLCAAPGGKSIALSWAGFDVTASDREGARLSLLRDSVARAAREVKVIEPEAIASSGQYDLVWVDAPCTGSGILRRHPDVRWLRREADLGSLKATQLDVIRRGWERVKPGGFFVYSVCSVFLEEGSHRIAEAGLAGNRVRDWMLAPQLGSGGDGFWACLLRK